jgi:sec-independent protein translocase protein TatB
VFDSIGWGEILVVALAALFIFGPERLPTLARDAATGLKKVRETMTGLREQVHDSLGEDFDHLRDVDLRRYHPRTFLREQLLGDEDLFREPLVHKGSATGTPGAAAAATTAPAVRPRDAATPPPFDVDAT